MGEQKPENSKRTEFLNGAKATIPLEIGAAPFGIIFGALAVTAGLSPAASQGMSLFVFAGSSQFIATGLIASGTGTLIIVLTTLVVNLRHMLYAATLSPYVKDLPQRWLLPLGFWLTDESFVVVTRRYQQEDDSPNKHWFFFGSAVFMYLNWQVWTFVGILAGQRIEDPLRWGLDFAMIVTFIGMLVPMVKNKAAALAVAAAGISAFLMRGLPNKLGLIFAAMIGVGIGMAAHEIIERSKGGNDVPSE
jgi:4-azaleucine resistance transporter AzlC